MQASARARGNLILLILIYELNKVICFSIAPDLGSPKTMNELLESKENKLAAIYNIQPVSCEKIALRKRQPEIKLTPDMAPEFHYPLYPLEPNEILSSHTTPQKKMFFLENDENRTSPNKEICSYKSHSDDIKSYTSTAPSTSSHDPLPDIPDVKKVPDYMNIPNLWNVQLIQPETENKKDEKGESHPDSSSSSEWELV